MVRSVKLTPQGPDFRVGWPLLVFGLCVAPLLFYVNLVLWRKLKTLHGIARVQTAYVFAGTLASELVVFGVDIVAPVMTGTTVYGRWGVVGYLLTVAAIAVAIAKHRLWDLGSIARMTAAAVVAVGSVVATLSGTVWLAQPLAPVWQANPSCAAMTWAMVGTLQGLMLVLFYQTLSGLLARTLQEERDRIGKLLTALGEAIVHAPPGKATLQPVLDETQRFFDASFTRGYLRDPAGTYYSAGMATGDAGINEPREVERHGSLPGWVVDDLRADGLTEPMDAGQLMRFGSVAEAEQKLKAMEAVRANVVVPLQWQSENIGLLVLGPKLSRSMYSASDVDLLKSAAAHAAIAVRNAELRAQLLAEKERTDKVLAQMESGVIVADSRRTIRLVNPAACSMLATQADELMGQHVRILPRSLRHHLHMALDVGKTVSDVRLMLGQQQGIRAACSTLVLQTPGGEREGAAIVFRDLRTEDALLTAERETERLQFIRVVAAGMAHEIRNPLVAIRTFAELAPDRLDDPDFRDSFIHVAQSEVNRLEQLVSQFMTLARPTHTVREPIDVGKFIESAVVTASASAQTKDITVATRVAPDLPRFRGDGDRLHQALMNLLLNALEATAPGGQIQVSAQMVSETYDETGDLAVTVWNSGSYIPPEERERVFEPFFSGKAEGTGLGLAICRTVVDEHGGSTTVESDEEGGTSFVMRLPVPPYHEATAMTVP